MPKHRELLENDSVRLFQTPFYSGDLRHVKILLKKVFAGIQMGKHERNHPKTAEIHCTCSAKTDCTAKVDCITDAEIGCTCREILHIYAKNLCISPNDSKRIISICKISVVICKSKAGPRMDSGTGVAVRIEGE